MSFVTAPWNSNLEPSQGSIRQYLDNLYAKSSPMETARWNESFTDSQFMAGNQSFVNGYFGRNNNSRSDQWYFNLLQQPINMVTGYQRQHRKQINYIPLEGSDTKTTDQYNKLITSVCNRQGIHEQFSRACEQAAVTGMVLLQPYLDFTGADPAQGELKLKLWEYNSFICDPWARELDFSDSQYIWTQEYISKKEAEERFPGEVQKISPMMASNGRQGKFYFLPEAQSVSQTDQMVLSYVWYKWQRKRKKLYSRSRNQFFDFGGDDNQMDQLLATIPDMEMVEIEVPTWKLAVVLNDQLVFQGDNPLGFDDCPFIPVLWNYEPHLSNYSLRVRGLVRTMRDSNYLLNRRIIINHEISETTINAGWKRKLGAVANEDNLKRTGQGWDVLVNDGYEMTDVEKILPSAVPESDMALADQLQSLIFSTSGVNLETWSAQDQGNASSLTVMLKQAANLMVLQKYFDQWDLSLKKLGSVMMKIVQNNWNAAKVGLMINEEPTPFFYSKVFADFSTVVEEGVLTPTQQYQEYQAWLELNQQLGGIIPPQELAKRAPIQGKHELMEMLAQQAMQQQAVQSEATNIQHAFETAKLQEMQSKAVNNLAMAKERYGRYEADLGLKDERESELTKNRALATKAKMEALNSMVDAAAKLGAVETMMGLNVIEDMQDDDIAKEDTETDKSRRDAFNTEFASKIMGNIPTMKQQVPQEQGMPGQQMPQQ
jgi:hypothetical protein